MKKPSGAEEREVSSRWTNASPVVSAARSPGPRPPCHAVRSTRAAKSEVNSEMNPGWYGRSTASVSAAARSGTPYQINPLCLPGNIVLPCRSAHWYAIVRRSAELPAGEHRLPVRDELLHVGGVVAVRDAAADAIFSHLRQPIRVQLDAQAGRGG